MCYSQQQVHGDAQTSANEEYPTVVIDVPVNNINNIRMILPQTQNPKKIQPLVVGSGEAVLLPEKDKKENNLIEEEPPPPTPVILDDIAAAEDILVQSPLTADAAPSTTLSPSVVDKMNLGSVTQADLTNRLSSPSVSDSQLDMQIACMDPTKNISPHVDKYG